MYIYIFISVNETCKIFKYSKTHPPALTPQKNIHQPEKTCLNISEHAYPIQLVSHPAGHFPHGRSAPAHWPSRHAAVGWDVGPGKRHPMVPGGTPK